MSSIYYTLTPRVILAIVGQSGVGKTTMAITMQKHGIPTIVSYTTRPMRDGETNGVEHIFVTPDKKPDKKDMLAYTKFGGYEYWAETSQVKRLVTYVVDEDGLRYLKQNFSKKYVIFSIYLKRDTSDIDNERKKRDNGRKLIDEKDYDIVINNTYTEEEFKNKIAELTENILNIMRP